MAAALSNNWLPLYGPPCSTLGNPQPFDGNPPHHQAAPQHLVGNTYLRLVRHQYQIAAIWLLTVNNPPPRPPIYFFTPKYHTRAAYTTNLDWISPNRTHGGHGGQHAAYGWGRPDDAAADEKRVSPPASADRVPEPGPAHTTIYQPMLAVQRHSP